MKEKVPLKDRIQHLLEELRIVLPGSQALLGFQLTTIFSQGFDKIEKPLQYIHLLSLGFIVLTILLLLIPASYHRIVEGGQDSEQLHTIASVLLIFAQMTLALGLMLDLYVVLTVVTKNPHTSLYIVSGSLMIFYTCLFGIPLLLKKKS